MVDPQLLSPLQSRLFSIEGIALTPKPRGERVALRAAPSAITKINKALSINLPKKPKSSASKGGITALWIGPDEWLLLADEGAGILDQVSAVDSDLYSVVDVSHRNTGIDVSGPLAETILSSGCPQNLAVGNFPVSAVSRTIFGKAEIVLYRTGGNSFHIECWRSFSDYVWKFLVDAAKSA